jgi:hypothetical protein
MRVLVAVVAIVAIGALAWNGDLFGAGGGSRLEELVKGLYADDYRGDFTHEPTSVTCPESLQTAELDAKRESWGAKGPFRDCTVTFDDGTSATSCWFKGPKDTGYRTLHVVEESGLVDNELSCQEFARLPSGVKHSDVYLTAWTP